MGNTWKPINRTELDMIIERDLKTCDSRQLAVWNKYSISPIKAPIERYSKMYSVFIVAIKENEAMYYEDFEDGFNLSPLGKDGQVLQHWCNQDELPFALNHWVSD